jgi:hypothetical protein
MVEGPALERLHSQQRHGKGTRFSSHRITRLHVVMSCSLSLSQSINTTIRYQNAHNLRLNLQGIGPMTFYFKFTYPPIFDMECEKCLQMRYAVVHILSFLEAYCLSCESLNFRSYSRRHNIHLHRSIFKSNFRQVTEYLDALLVQKVSSADALYLAFSTIILTELSMSYLYSSQLAFALSDVRRCTLWGLLSAPCPPGACCRYGASGARCRSNASGARYPFCARARYPFCVRCASSSLDIAGCASGASIAGRPSDVLGARSPSCMPCPSCPSDTSRRQRVRCALPVLCAQRLCNPARPSRTVPIRTLSMSHTGVLTVPACALRLLRPAHPASPPALSPCGNRELTRRRSL